MYDQSVKMVVDKMDIYNLVNEKMVVHVMTMGSNQP